MKKEPIFSKVEKITYLTPASPVVLVSTKSGSGINNVAPFGMFMVASTEPPMVLVAVSPKADTHANIVETKEFVVAVPKPSIVDQVYAAGGKFPPEADEFTCVGLTPYSSNIVRPPKVAECCVNLECTLEWSQSAGNHTIFCGVVVDADIDRELYQEGMSPVELRGKVSEIYHLTGKAFLSGNKIVWANE